MDWKGCVSDKWQHSGMVKMRQNTTITYCCWFNTFHQPISETVLDFKLLKYTTL